MLERVRHPATMKSVPIGDLVDDVPTRNPTLAGPDLPFTYIDLSAVDQDQKAIIAARRLLGADAPSRARQLVKEGDVLVSTVRPNLNGVAVVSDEHDQAIASTGFCVLRPSRGKLDSSFLFHWVRSKPFVENMIRLATGASYPAVSDGIVRKSLIPTPPLPEQRRIAAILDQADALRAKRRAALAQLDEMAQAIFVEMFGAAPYGQYTLLGDCVVEFRYGTSNKSDIEGRPTLRIPNVIRDQIDLRDLKNVPVTDAEFRRLQLRPNDVLFVRTNGNPDNVGRCACVDEDLGGEIGLSPSDFIFASYLIRARLNPERLRGVFTRAYFSTPDGRNQIREYAKTSAGQFNINMESLGTLKVPLVPISAQSVFETRLRAVLEHRRHHEAHATQLDALFTSLQHRAFNGEL